MARRPTTTRPPVAPPASILEGAALVRAYVLSLFVRPDGEAADKRLMTGSLFRAAFDTLDTLPAAVREATAQRVHEELYSRFMASDAADAGASKTDPSAAISAPANTGVLKSPRPNPPKGAV